MLYTIVSVNYDGKTVEQTDDIVEARISAKASQWDCREIAVFGVEEGFAHVWIAFGGTGWVKYPIHPVTHKAYNPEAGVYIEANL